MAGYIGSKAVLLSTTAATVTGDMTVDTSTLKVDSTNNKVGIGTASPSHPLHIVTSTDGTGVSGDDTWAAIIQNAEATDGRSYGLKIMAGSTTDQAFAITDHDGSNDLMAVDGYGHVTKPKQPAFLVHASGQSNIALSTQVALTMGTEIFDNNADYSSNTFTAPVTGRYQFSWHVRFDNLDSAATYYRVYMAASNRTFWTVYRATHGFVSDTDYWSFNGAHLVDMDANDTCQLGVLQADGTQQTDIDNETHFCGFLVC